MLSNVFDTVENSKNQPLYEVFSQTIELGHLAQDSLTPFTVWENCTKRS